VVGPCFLNVSLIPGGESRVFEVCHQSRESEAHDNGVSDGEALGELGQPTHQYNISCYRFLVGFFFAKRLIFRGTKGVGFILSADGWRIT